MRKRRPGNIPFSRPLADLVQTAIDPVLRRQGFGQSDLALFWDDIVGERLAAMSQPVKVQWPVRQHGRAAENGPAPATLIVRVETGFALELQHLAPIVIDEIRVQGSRCGPFAPALRALSQRRVDVRPLISARYSLDEGLQAFEHATKPGVLKVLVQV